jgi:hypothetical protein
MKYSNTFRYTCARAAHSGACKCMQRPTPNTNRAVGDVRKRCFPPLPTCGLPASRCTLCRYWGQPSSNARPPDVFSSSCVCAGSRSVGKMYCMRRSTSALAMAAKSLPAAHRQQTNQRIETCKADLCHARSVPTFRCQEVHQSFRIHLSALLQVAAGGVSYGQGHNSTPNSSSVSAPPSPW